MRELFLWIKPPARKAGMETDRTTDRTFETKNLFTASFILTSKKAQFLGIKTIDSYTKVFIFSPEDVCSTLEASYLSGDSIPARELFENYKTLREMLKRGGQP